MGADGGGVFVEHLREDARRDVSVPGEPPGEELVGHHGERKLVGAGVDRLSQRLLGRGVGDGPHGGAAARELRGGEGRAVGFIGDGLHDPEVEEHDAPLGGDDDVVGLHVAVDKPHGVRRVERHGELAHQPKDLFACHPSLPDERAEGLPLDEGHHQIELPILRFADRQHARDAPRVQGLRGPRFALEAALQLGEVARGAVDQLDRDLPPSSPSVARKTSPNPPRPSARTSR